MRFRSPNARLTANFFHHVWETPRMVESVIMMMLVLVYWYPGQHHQSTPSPHSSPTQPVIGVCQKTPTFFLFVIVVRGNPNIWICLRCIIQQIPHPLNPERQIIVNNGRTLVLIPSKAPLCELPCILQLSENIVQQSQFVWTLSKGEAQSRNLWMHI